MTDRALLPTGLEDILPTQAEFEAQVVQRLMDTFSSFGYDRVKPPLIEFEDNLLQGSGSAIASQTFRVMDPISQRMLGIRPDMTVQVERIASTRLMNAPRPLRLCYTGQVLRVRGSHLRPERQFGQAGVEIIGSALPTSDAEVMAVALSALEKSGLKDLSIDLGLPCLIPALCAHYNIDEALKDDLRLALDRKDAAAMKDLAGGAADLFAQLIQSAGPGAEAIEVLKSLGCSGEAKNLIAHLLDVYTIIQQKMPNVTLTIDTVENRGYEYHTGVSYTFYAKGARGELGRGGRYKAGSGEDATGCTLFIDSILRALPKATPAQKVFLPYGSTESDGERLRKEGLITLFGLEETTDSKAEAKRLGCSHICLNGNLTPID